MMKVYFEDGNYNRTFIDNARDEEEAFRIVCQECKKRGYKSCYMRSWDETSMDGSTEYWFDYGSHVNFFVVVEDK